MGRISDLRLFPIPWTLAHTCLVGFPLLAQTNHEVLLFVAYPDPVVLTVWLSITCLDNKFEDIIVSSLGLISENTIKYTQELDGKICAKNGSAVYF